VTKLLARAFLRMTGWKPEGHRPAARRYVLIAAPHTSNWDLAYLLALAAVLEVKIAWMGKHQLFHGPMGTVMRKLGGVPVRRGRRNDLVQQMADLIREHDSIALTVPAEGTRGYVPHWKSGFYHIASRAEVPIVLGYLDYARKRGGFGPEIIPTGDVRQDMDEIRAFYADKRGRHPELEGAVRLKEES
jgi:1-acyl-sn-glycerol-3-phosphate acyltransferase